MTKLHEILAVDKDKEKQVQKITEETSKVFRSAAEYFLGYNKSLRMFNEEEQEAANALAEEKPIVTTVPERADYTFKLIADLIDIQMAKESTNQHAIADIVVDGITVATDVPATMLLYLERELTKHRQILSHMPTLDQSMEWEPAPEKGEHIFRTKRPVQASRTRKSYEIITLAEATKEHKAQVEKVTVDKAVGTWTTQFWSGSVTPARKAQILTRFDALIQAVKQARMRANETEVKHEKIGQSLFDFVFDK
jgi:hypothetical protein